MGEILPGQRDHCERHDLLDFGNGIFATVPTQQEYFFADLDLYLMGFFPPEEVEPFFVVLDPDVEESKVRLDKPFHGRRHDVTVQDIIAVEGERYPDYRHSQKHFRVGFVYLRRGGEPTTDELGFIEQVRAGLPQMWHRETRGLSTLDTTLVDSGLIKPYKGHMPGTAAKP